MRLLSLGLALLFLTPSVGQAGPNLVVLLVDDLGWADTSLPHAPSDFYETPNLEVLAAQGVLYTQAYSAAQICSPSRAGFLTGRTPAELRATANELSNIDGWETIPEALKGIDAYTTAHIGKWNLLGSPLDHGFDVASLYSGDTHSPPPDDPKWMGSVTDAALDFLATASSPFYLQLNHYAPHVPIESYPDTLAYFQAKPPGTTHDDAAYAAMVHDLDDALGEILAVLPPDTFVVFTSDNGGHDAISSNAPLRGGKVQLFEGGIRVPLVVAGPGIVPGTSNDFVVGWDLKNLLVSWAGGAPDPARTPVWHFPWYQHLRTSPVSAIRLGNRKLLHWWWSGVSELYDVVTDPGETTPLPWDAEAVQLEADLLALLDAVEAEDPPPPPPPPPRPRVGCGLGPEIPFALLTVWVWRRWRSPAGRAPARRRQRAPGSGR